MKNTSLANSTIVKWVSQKVSTTAALVSGSVLSVISGLPVKIYTNSKNYLINLI